MKNVLIVDDDKGFLLSLEEMLKESGEQFSVTTAYNGKEAVDALTNQSINLVVTDLKMPEMDGFSLIAHMSSATPDIPVIAMTAFGTPEMEDNLMEMGAFQYIEKPIDFNTLLAKIKEGLEAGSKGRIAGISISSFLQLLELDHKTCTLTVISQDRKGFLYFLEGEMINATYGELVGQDAAMEIITWEQVEIEILNICRKRKRVIQVPLGFILIEGARMKDEKAEQIAVQQTKEEQEPELETVEDLDFDVAPLPKGEESIAGIEDLTFDTVAGEKEDDLGIDDLTFATTETVPEPFPPAPEPEPSPPEPEPSPPEPADPIDFLVESIAAINGVVSMVVLSLEGKIVASDNSKAEEFGEFIAYTAKAGKQVQNLLGLSSAQHIIMSQPSGHKLLVIIGQEIVLGIEISTGLSPHAVVDSLKPIVKRTTLP